MNSIRKTFLDLYIRYISWYESTWLAKHFARNRDYIYQESIRKRFANAAGVKFGKDMFILGEDCISVGAGTYFGNHSILTAWKRTCAGGDFHPSITIGENCGINEYTHITAINHISLGNNVRIGRYVTITDNSHGNTDFVSLTIPPQNRMMFSKGPVIIGNNVWVGDKATILPGVTIGEGSVIAANSVVAKDIPAYCVAGGCPAKIIKQHL